MREINTIILHCSATPEGRDVDTNEIRRWHLKRGFTDVGYHFIIKIDGTLEFGRPIDKVGAHTRGFNRESIGICLVGGYDKDMQNKDTRTDAQKVTLEGLLKMFKSIYTDIEVLGHYELSTKTCPNFNIDEYR